jgi:hypothetical protein
MLLLGTNQASDRRLLTQSYDTMLQNIQYACQSEVPILANIIFENRVRPNSMIDIRTTDSSLLDANQVFGLPIHNDPDTMIRIVRPD